MIRTKNKIKKDMAEHLRDNCARFVDTVIENGSPAVTIDFTKLVDSVVDFVETYPRLKDNSNVAAARRT